MKHALLGLLLALPAAAQTPDIAANPTLWHVKGAGGDVYLLGSIHILPPQVKWRSPKVAAAIAKSDVSVFEVPLDAASIGKIQDVVLTKGYLPADQPLREMVHPEYRDDYDAAVVASGADPALLARERPWLLPAQVSTYWPGVFLGGGGIHLNRARYPECDGQARLFKSACISSLPDTLQYKGHKARPPAVARLRINDYSTRKAAWITSITF